MNMRYDAFEFLKELAKSTYDKRELNKSYWVAEWSWNPIVDGISPCKEILRFVQEFKFSSGAFLFSYTCQIYQTSENNRYYFPWEIYSTETDARIACNIMNSWGYDIEAARKSLLEWIAKCSGQKFIDKSIDQIYQGANL
jgi:hypothetical protein